MISLVGYEAGKIVLIEVTEPVKKSVLIEVTKPIKIVLIEELVTAPLLVWRQG